jgi:hypothetical protein
MPARSRTSFQKRQKELMRAEKQRDKAARRQARKLAPKETGEPDVQPEAGAETEIGTETETGAEPEGSNE